MKIELNTKGKCIANLGKLWRSDAQGEGSASLVLNDEFLIILLLLLFLLLAFIGPGRIDAGLFLVLGWIDMSIQWHSDKVHAGISIELMASERIIAIIKLKHNRLSLMYKNECT